MTVTSNELAPSDGALLSNTAMDRLNARPYWHTIATPDTVATAWTAVTEIVDQLLDLSDRWERVGVADAAALNEYETAYQKATEAGTKAPKPPTLTDPVAERQIIRAEHRSLNALAARHRRTYDRAVAEALPEWRENVLADADPAASLAQARKAHATLDAALRRHNATVANVVAMTRALDPDWGTQPSDGSRVRQLRTDLGTGLNSVSTFLGSADPAITGDALTDPVGIHPPASIRRWMADYSEIHRRDLHTIEDKENYQVTDYTRNDPSGGYR